jgi:hypothetical protein
MGEQHLYARWLDVGTRAGFVVLIVTFLIYVFGLLDPLVPLPELERLWVLPVDRYVAASGAPTGWGWVRFLDRGDYLNFVGIAALGSITVVCYARVIPVLSRMQALIAALQILVLLAAASGLIPGA